MGEDSDMLDGTPRDQAAAWFVRLRSDTATDADFMAFTSWLEASPAHGDAYDRVETLWLEMDERAAELTAGPTLEPAPSARVIAFAPRRPKRKPRPEWRIAAGIGLVALLAGGAGVYTLMGGTPTAYETAIGQTRTVTLADRSVVAIGPATRLTVRLGWSARRVSLERGEADFDVAKNPGRPFLVAAGDRRVRVVGTSFDVLRDQGRVVVAVARGVVEVRPARSQLGADAVRLLPGDVLRHSEGAAADVIAHVDPTTTAAWRRGSLVYRDRPLAEVAGDLNRRFKTPIRLDAGVSDLRFSGVLIMDDEAYVVRRLESLLPVRAETVDGAVYLRSSRPAG